MDNTKLSPNFIKIWLFILLIIAAYIRVKGVGDYYYNGDEALHVRIASGESLEQVFKFSLYEVHPPLGNFISHYWLMISNEIWFVRGLALLFGLALIPLYYAIGKRLNGELTGICSAFLVAFSNELITQSYIVRNYTVFVFFLSVAFFYYLKWKDKKQFNKNLILYFIFAALACLTHFSGILAIFIIAVYETIIVFLSKSEKLILVKWFATNIIIAVISVATYYIWQPASVDTIEIKTTYIETLIKSINYVIALSGDITFGSIFVAISFAWIPLVLKHNNKIAAILFMNIAAFGLTIILVINKFYDQVNRHSLWLSPFIIPLLAWIMADVYKIISKEFSKNKNINQQKIFVIILIILGVISYNKNERFSNAEEYTAFMKDWQNVDKYLSGIDEKSAIIAEAGDVGLLGNIYKYFNKDWWHEDKRAITVMPYNSTKMIFSSHGTEYIEKNIFIEHIKWINENHLLENLDNLIFMSTNWTGKQSASSQIPLLFVCPELNKKIVSFPSLKPNETITKENIYSYTALFMTVSKKDFFEQVISPTGKANVCLDRKLK